MEDMRDQEDIIQTVLSTINMVAENRSVIYGGDNDSSHSISNEFSKKIKELCNAMKDQSTKEKLEYVKNVEIAYEKCRKLARELNVEFNSDYSDTMPLFEMLTSSQSTILKFSGIKRERFRRYNALKKEEEILCKDLKEVPSKQCNGTPTVQAIKELEDNIHRLNELKENIIHEIRDCCNKVKSVMQRIEIKPITPLELFCFDDSRDVPYSKDTLADLKIIEMKYEDKQKYMREHAASLKNTLRIIWTRLEKPVHNQEIILTECNGHTRPIIMKLEAELKRCEAMKQRNIMQYIKKIKDELQDYWVKCLFSEEDKEKCKPFFMVDCNVDIADLLEIELNKISSFYSKYQEIFHLYDLRNELWNKFSVLEETSKNSDRLCNNRGGALPKEENERKQIKKELLKVEEKLKTLLSEFEKQERREFTVLGQNLRDIIEDTWNDWHVKKIMATYAGSVKTAIVKTPITRNRRNITPATFTATHHEVPSTPSVDLSTASSYSLFQEHVERGNDTQKTPFHNTHTPSNILKPRNTPMPNHSSPKNRFSPYPNTRNTSKVVKSQHKKSPFKVGATSKIPMSTVSPSARITSQLRTPRRKLPIII